MMLDHSRSIASQIISRNGVSLVLGQNKACLFRQMINHERVLSRREVYRRRAAFDPGPFPKRAVKRGETVIKAV